MRDDMNTFVDFSKLTEFKFAEPQFFGLIGRQSKRINKYSSINTIFPPIKNYCSITFFQEFLLNCFFSNSQTSISYFTFKKEPIKFCSKSFIHLVIIFQAP